MRINHNITAMNSYRNFSANTSKLSKNLEKLSTGLKINRAGDDAAGLAISEKMRVQISGIEGATKNAKDGISLVQTAEGALTEVHDMLNRMVTLAEQSANGTYDNDVDRNQLQKEVEALKSEIDRIADSTNYNGIKLLDGSLSGDGTGSVTKAVDVSGAQIHKHVIDATKSNTVLTIATAGSDIKTKALDGKDVTLNIGLDDGRKIGVTVSVKKNGSTMEIVGKEDGKAYGSYATNATKGAVQKAMNAALVKAAKDTALGETFDVTGDNTNGKTLTFTSKEAGADGLLVDSFDLVVTDSKTGAEEKDLSGTDAANSSKGFAANKALAPTKTAGADATDVFEAGKLVTYQPTLNDNKGNANKAVFEVNGVKFAIGAVDTDLSDLDSDVNFIGIVTTTAGSGAFDTSTDGGATSYGVTATSAAMIAHEISQKAGVEVKFTSVAASAKIDDGVSNTAVMPAFSFGTITEKSGKALTLQIGDTSDSFNQMSVDIADMHHKSLGLGDLDISTQEGATTAIDTIRNAVNQVSDVRGSLGALQNRLDHTINNLGVMRENIQNAESLIRDTDVAEEMMTYTKNNILNQSAQAMLAQANQLPQGVLQLLG